MKKQFALPAIHFKGSGWAKKDRSTSSRASRGEAKGEPKTEEVSAGSGSGDSAGSGSGDSAGDAPASSTEGSKSDAKGGSSDTAPTPSGKTGAASAGSD